MVTYKMIIPMSPMGNKMGKPGANKKEIHVITSIHEYW